MKIRTHITIERNILAKVEEDAKKFGISMSALVSLLIVGNDNRSGWFPLRVPAILDMLETVIVSRENGMQEKIEKALGCPLPEGCSPKEGVEFLINRYNELREECSPPGQQPTPSG